MVGGHHNTRKCVEGSQRLRATVLGSSMETVEAVMYLVPFSHRGLTEGQMLDAFEDAHHGTRGIEKTNKPEMPF